MVSEWSHRPNSKMVCLYTLREEGSISAFHQLITALSHSAVSIDPPNGPGRRAYYSLYLKGEKTDTPSCLLKVHTLTHTHTLTLIHTHTLMYSKTTHTLTHIHSHSRLRTLTHSHTHTDSRTQSQTFTHTHTRTYTFTHTFTPTHTAQ